MKLFELIEQVDPMEHPKTRQAQLKAEIAAGHMPIVQNVSGSASPVYTMSDVEALGWMTKDYYNSYGDVAWKRYYHSEAPGAIRVANGSGTEVWEPGFQEEEM